MELGKHETECVNYISIRDQHRRRNFHLEKRKMVGQFHKRTQNSDMLKWSSGFEYGEICLLLSPIAFYTQK